MLRINHLIYPWTFFPLFIYVSILQLDFTLLELLLLLLCYFGALH